MKTRHLVYLAFALLGLGLAGLLEDWGLLPQSPSLLSLNRLYLALAGLLTGLLLGPRLEGALEARLKRLRSLPPEVVDRKSTRLNSSHSQQSRMPSSA